MPTGNYLEHIMNKSDKEENLIQNLELDNKRSKRSIFKKLIYFALIIIIVTICYTFVRDNREESEITYKTEQVRNERLTIVVSATGRIEPRNQVDVGSELSGIVKTVNVDCNDNVSNGQALATLDKSKMEAQVEQSRASFESAKAKILEVKATVTEAQNELNRLRQVWEISGNKVPSKQELDKAEAAYQRAIATEASANAQMLQAKATLNVNETDLKKMIIRSPVNGIVLARNVEPGQTVAASFQAPVLFTLAEDLTKMELSVDIDEADVGKVNKNQDASFTVDAYPDKIFNARTKQVKFGSNSAEGVVTYETVLSVDNKELLLRPGMTATTEIIVNDIENAVLIPNAAIRFAVQFKTKDDETSPEEKEKLFSKFRPGPPIQNASTTTNIEERVSPGDIKTVYILENNKPVSISIKTGLTDGRMTQITGGDLKPGTYVITSVIEE